MTYLFLRTGSRTGPSEVRKFEREWGPLFPRRNVPATLNEDECAFLPLLPQMPREPTPEHKEEEEES